MSRQKQIAALVARVQDGLDAARELAELVGTKIDGECVSMQIEVLTAEERKQDEARIHEEQIRYQKCVERFLTVVRGEQRARAKSPLEAAQRLLDEEKRRRAAQRSSRR